MPDYYDILGVARGASGEDIKRAYRRLAHQHHPDKAGGDEEKFKQINEAYQVLSDEGKRAQYDQFGGQDPFAGFQGFGANIDFSDIFEQVFGGAESRRSRTRERVGDDVAIDITISFRESATGSKKDVSPRMYQTCEVCRGNSAKPGTPIKDCATCGGQGSVEQTRQTPFGLFRQRSVCPTCQGEGKIAATACENCRGQGRVMASQSLTIEIPAGIADGQTLRLAGRGEAAARGGRRGDLYVNVHVEPDAILRRDGDDVRSTVPVSISQAALGATIDIDTLAGRQSLDIPAGTQPGSEFRLARQGFASLRSGGKGDQIVTVQIQIPKRLTRRQRQALEEFS